MLLEAWKSQVADPAPATILPDGCQDLLFTAYPGNAPRWEITSLDDTAYQIEMPRGAYFKGFRLRAGVEVDAGRLCAAMQDLPPDHADIVDRLYSFTTLDGLVEETLSALQEQASAGGNLAGVAHDCGYADQPHMHRAFRQWLGTTPAKLPALSTGYG